MEINLGLLLITNFLVFLVGWIIKTNIKVCRKRNYK